MPHQLRPGLADVQQHVAQRGNDRQSSFYVTDDCRRYLAGLRESTIRYGCSVHAYVLVMTMHERSEVNRAIVPS